MGREYMVGKMGSFPLESGKIDANILANKHIHIDIYLDIII